MMCISIKSFVMNSGERYCLLVDHDTGLPLYNPNLYVTTQVRNRSLSYSAMESALGGKVISTWPSTKLDLTQFSQYSLKVKS